MDWLECLSKWLPILISFVLVLYVVKQIGVMKASTAVDLVIRLEEKFNSQQMRSARKVTADACLKVLKQDKDQKEEKMRFSAHEQTFFLTIMDFFETTGLITRRSFIDPYFVWCLFGDWILEYYCMFQQDLNEIREKEDPSFYENLLWLVSKIESIEKKKGKRSIDLTDQDKLEFFELEANL